MSRELARGATLHPDGSVTFAVWAPDVEALRVHLLTGPASGMHAMQRAGDADGVFVVTVAGTGAGADYAIVLPDGRELPDPVSRWQPHGVHGASRVVDPQAFAWTDGSWRGIGLSDCVIYEMHVGAFTPAGTFDAAIGELPRLKALGITALEIMPVAQFPGERNWGYDGVHLYAVQHSYGGPEGLKRLVDAAHAHGIAVVLDVVYNHFGPEGNYLDAFGPYFTDTYRTPWGRAVNYDGAQSDEVRRLVIDNARYWVQEYHVDALRLDAVHGIFDMGAVHLLEELTEAVHDVGAALGRTVLVIGESDLNDPRLVRPRGQGGYALDAQWSDDFHHAVHALLTGESRGYYEDFGDADGVVAAFREPFVYDGRHSAHRKRRHGGPSTGLPRTNFVVAVQNHDQVGNRAAGDRLGTLLAPAKQRLAAALLLLSPYVPLIFMGEEYGETNPFQYFISHSDPQLVEAVRAGRRAEFAAFGWAGEVPDPQAESTFERSKLDLAKAARQPHSGILALYRDLIALRQSEPALRPDGSAVEVSIRGSAVLVARRPSTVGRGDLVGCGPSGVGRDDDRDLLSVFNLGDVEHSVPLPTGPSEWRLEISTDAAVYGGGDSVHLSGHQLSLPPWTAALLSGLR